MAKKRRRESTVYCFVISKTFPTNDPIAIDLLRLMAGCNDILFLDEWLNAHKKVPKKKHIAKVAAGRNSLQIRLMYSFLVECLKVVKDMKGRTEFATVQSSLDNEGRTALQELLKVKLRLKSEERDGGLNHSLLKTRDTATFHYDFRKVKEALEFWLKEKGGRKSHF